METMSYLELFTVGKSFEAAIGEGSKSERLRIPKNMSRIHLSDEIIEYVENISETVNFLVTGEIWCPDFQINISILKIFCDLNPNFNLSVITMGRGKKYLSQLLGIEKDELKYPTVAVLDADFELVGTFFERPQSVLACDFEEIKRPYYKGEYLNDSVLDFVEILKKF